MIKPQQDSSMSEKKDFFRDRKCLRIAIDFDGTIVEHKYPDIGDFLPYALEVLYRLKAAGHKIIIWTARCGKDLERVKQFVKSKKVPHDGINCNLTDSPYRSWPKIMFDLCFDDRNVGGLVPWLEFEQIVYRVANGGENERIK